MPDDPRLRELIAEALESDCTPEELCVDCPELLPPLRERLQRLRAVQAQIGELFPAASAATPPLDAASSEAEGSRDTVTTPATDAFPAVPGYQLLEQVGAGGMGVVYRARDQVFRRSLAVKMLACKHRDNADLKRRFLDEAQLMGQLQHPGIPPVHDLGEMPDGRPYFAMKLIKGRSLAAILRERGGDAPAQPQLIGIFEQVCRTLAYCHAQGIIHRDLKPANVMVGAFGEVQVMDWGLAKVLGAGAETVEPHGSVISTVRSGESDWATHAGVTLGTPAYMAPEQARGEIAQLDARCDVFGLGAILCEILTGQPPFGGGTAQDVLTRAQRGQTAEALARLDRCGADEELVQIARYCLASVREDRPANGGAVLAAVTAYLATVQERLRQAEIARAQAEVQAAEEQRRRLLETHRRRLLLGLAAAVVLLLAAVGGASLWVQHEQAITVQAQQQAANADHEKAREQAKATAAEAEKLRKTLAGYHAEAESRLAEVRMLRHAVGKEEARQKVLQQIERFGELRDRAARTAQEPAVASETLALDEQRRWDEHTANLRNEATHWFTGIELARGRSIVLPEGEGPTAGEMPNVALRPDRQQIALVYPGSSAVLILGTDGTVQKQLAVPPEVAQRARVSELRVKQTLNFTARNTAVNFADARLAYVGSDCLQYRVGTEVLSWQLPDGKPTPPRPEPSTGRSIAQGIASCDRYVALREPFTTVITVRDWKPGAKPVAMWQPRDLRDTGQREELQQMVFDADGRALFMQTNTRLCVVDAASGVMAEAPLAREKEEVRYGRVVPCPSAVALVEP